MNRNLQVLARRTAEADIVFWADATDVHDAALSAADDAPVAQQQITHLQNDVQGLRAQVISINDRLAIGIPSPTVPQPSDPADADALFCSTEREVIHAIATRATRLAVTEDQHARDVIRDIVSNWADDNVPEFVRNWADNDLEDRVSEYFDTSRGERLINNAVDNAIEHADDLITDSNFSDKFADEFNDRGLVTDDNFADKFSDELDSAISDRNLIDRDDLTAKIDEAVEEARDDAKGLVANLRSEMRATLRADFERERGVTFAAIDAELLGPKGDKFAAHVAAAVVNMFSGLTLEQRLAFIVTGTLPVTPAPVADVASDAELFADEDSVDRAERALRVE